jgi:hypothetical protein
LLSPVSSRRTIRRQSPARFGGHYTRRHAPQFPRGGAVHRRHRRLLLGRWSVLTFVAFIVTQPDPTKTHETLLPQAEHLVLGPKAGGAAKGGFVCEQPPKLVHYRIVCCICNTGSGSADKALGIVIFGRIMNAFGFAFINAGALGNSLDRLRLELLSTYSMRRNFDSSGFLMSLMFR